MKTFIIICFVSLSLSSLFPQNNKFKSGLYVVSDEESCRDTINFSRIIYSDDTLCIENKSILTDANFKSINVSMDSTSYGVKYALAINLDSASAITFGKITERLVGKKIAIIVDNKVVSAPILRAPITSGRIAVFSDKETILEIAKKLKNSKK